MVCFAPIKGFRSRDLTAAGKRSFVIDPKQGYSDRPMTIPCGQCIGCRLERSRQWAIRCVHESSLYEKNCFITLTYSTDKLPSNGSLAIRDWQLFMKRLRKRFGSKIRFYACGEYGEQLGRPHYHACLFNFDFDDKVPFKKTKSGEMIYLSPSLDETWGLGLSSVGAVTFNSAAYVARYIMKKQTGPEAETHYWFVDSDGVVHDRKPEFTVMSRRPGIAKAWFDKFKTDVFPDDFVVHDNKKLRVPRYYSNQYELSEAQHFARLKGRRKRQAKKHAADQTPERLRVRENVQLARLKKLKREIE